MSLFDPHGGVTFVLTSHDKIRDTHMMCVFIFKFFLLMVC